MLEFPFKMSEKSEISKPGQSDQLILPSEAKKVDPDFFNGRPQDWVLRIKREDGSVEELTGVDWEAVSPFGAVRSAVVADENGKPVFDRPRYEEALSVNIVAWGIDKQTRQIKIALLSQPRPHADDPVNPVNSETLVFSQIPMGFTERVLGKIGLTRWADQKRMTRVKSSDVKQNYLS